MLRIAEATYNEYKDEWVVESTQQNPGQHSFNTMNQGGKACHKCGSTQHLKRNCPKLGNSNRGGNTIANGNNNRSNQRGNQDPCLVAPNPSDSCCSKVSDSPHRWDCSFEDGITRSWCAKCVLRRTSTRQGNTNPGCWTDGGAKHYTDEHRGNNTTWGNSNRANLARSNGNGKGSQSQSTVPNEVQTEGNSTSQSSATQQSENTATSGNVLSLAQALNDLSQWLGYHLSVLYAFGTLAAFTFLLPFTSCAIDLAVVSLQWHCHSQTFIFYRIPNRW